MNRAYHGRVERDRGEEAMSGWTVSTLLPTGIVEPTMGAARAAVAPRKRMFDLLVVVLSSVAWLPVLALCALAILVQDGRPVFYLSHRRVFRDRSMRLAKFRTMRRDAERIANRETVPVSTQRFLNIRSDSPLYTRAGRMIERCALTELPQLWYVIRGQMSLVGNRPLPENVIASLREIYPDAEARFRTPTGLTGPAQLVGRDWISDRDRLSLESAYCRHAEAGYRMSLDFMILLQTVVIAICPTRRMTVDQVHRMMERHARRQLGIGIARRLPSR